MPTLPAYRNDFFSLLEKELGSEYKLTVAYSNKAGVGKKIPTENSVFFNSIGFDGTLINLFGYRIIWIKRLMKYVINFKPDLTILLFNSGILNLLIAQIYFMITGRKYLLWSCGHKRAEITGWRLVLKNLINDFFNKRATGHISYGNYYANELVSRGIPSQRVFVAQNTLNVENILLLQLISKEKARKKLNIPADAIVFIYVGALIKSKNLIFAAGIFKKLIDENNKLFFLVIGDGTEKEKLRQYIEESSLTYNIRLHSSVFGQDLIPYFSASDVFLLPGTGGLAVNEAMAYSMPVISTKGDGTVYDLVFDKQNGYLIKDDLSDLGDRIKDFIRMDLSIKDNMGMKSKEIVTSKATLRNMVDQFICVIKKFT